MSSTISNGLQIRDTPNSALGILDLSQSRFHGQALQSRFEQHRDGALLFGLVSGALEGIRIQAFAAYGRFEVHGAYFPSARALAERKDSLGFNVLGNFFEI